MSNYKLYYLFFFFIAVLLAIYVSISRRTIFTQKRAYGIMFLAGGLSFLSSILFNALFNRRMDLNFVVSLISFRSDLDDSRTAYALIILGYTFFTIAITGMLCSLFTKSKN